MSEEQQSEDLESLIAAKNHLAQAHAQLQKGDYLDAINTLKNVIQNFPEGLIKSEAALVMGYSRFKMASVGGSSQQSKNAFEDLRSIAKTCSDFWYSHLIMGRAYRTLGDTANAKSAFERALKLEPNNEEVLNSLENLHTVTGVRPKNSQTSKEKEAAHKGLKLVGSIFFLVASLGALAYVTMPYVDQRKPPLIELEPSITASVVPATKVMRRGPHLIVTVDDAAVTEEPEFQEAQELCENLKTSMSAQGIEYVYFSSQEHQTLNVMCGL